jgi:hopanoid biosynthesis associated RND transporter like protein HpnN
LTLLAALALVILSAYLAATRLSFLTQRNDLVSPRQEHQQRWRQYLAEFGDDDDMVVLVKGGDRAQMTAALEYLAAELQARPQSFDRIFYKVDLSALRDRALLYLPVEQIHKIQDSLQGMHLLLEPPLGLGKIDPLLGWKSLNLIQLLGEAERRTYAIPAGSPLRTQDREFFAQLTKITQTAADVLDDPRAYRNPWTSVVPAPDGQQDLMAEPQYFFSEDGSLAFLLARPAKDLASFTSADKSIDELRQLVADMGAQFPALQFGLTGLPVLENDEMIASQLDTATASWLALLGVAVLYLIVYRCLRYPFLTVTTLLIGTVWATGWLTLTVGHLNILSATFAVMLIGVGDYGVLWVSRYEQERASGADREAAMRWTAISIGPSIVTAALTTALAFFAAMLADFRAVVELGWIAGCGILLCALACFTVLPALLTLTDRHEAAPKITLRLAARREWLPWLNRHPRWVLAGALALVAASAVFAFGVRYDHNLLNLQARGLESVRWELELIQRTSGAGWHALSITATPEEALALKARYEKLPGVSRVVEVASLIPREQELKLALLRDIQHRLRGLPRRGGPISQLPPEPAQVTGQVARLLSALRPLAKADSSAVLAELGLSLEQLHRKASAAEPAVVAERLRDFDQRLAGDLAEDLHRLRDVCSPQPITTADLPASLRERYVGASGKWLVRVFGAGSLWEYGALQEFVRQVCEVDPDATGKPFTTLDGLRAMKEGFLRAALYALIAMLLVFLADFRNLWHTLLALSPLVAGVVVSLGVMGLFGLPLNPANMIALPLILGVGADNGVHIVHDYLSRRRGGRYALSYCTGRGILVAALTTVLGFGTLMIAHHRGLAGLGLLLTLGVSCCALTALVFLPAALGLLAGRRQLAVSREAPAAARAA